MNVQKKPNNLGVIEVPDLLRSLLFALRNANNCDFNQSTPPQVVNNKATIVDFGYIFLRIHVLESHSSVHRNPAIMLGRDYKTLQAACLSAGVTKQTKPKKT